MSLATQVVSLPAVAAVVDDDATAADYLTVLLEDAGIRSHVLLEGFKDIDAAITQIEGQATAAVCDHRLSPRGYAQFSGAELVARLYERRVPAILTTQFPMDADVSIRRWRERIPVLISRNDLEPHSLTKGFEQCIAELRGEYTTERIARRTIVRIANRTSENNEEVVDAFVPAWRLAEAVRFPLGLVDEQVRDVVRAGARLAAEVNVGARHGSELFFRNFEAMADPPDDDAFSLLINS